jgi:DNA primase
MNERQQAIQRIQQEVRLRRVCEALGRETKSTGSRLKTICPFHDDHEPSLHIYENTNNDQYHCYVCGAHGNVFEFIKKVRNCDFPEALAWLSNLSGIKVPSASTSLGADLREYGLIIGLRSFQKNARTKANQTLLERWANKRNIALADLQKAGVLHCSGVGLYKKAEQASGEELEALEQAGLLTKETIHHQ